MPLKRQLAELEQLFMIAPVGLFLLDREYRFIHVNRRLSEINRIPVEQHIGRTIWEVLPDLADNLARAYRPVYERGEPVLNVEIQRGENFYLANFYPYHLPAPAPETGELIGLIGAVLDITDRKRSEEAMRIREEQLNAFFNSSPAGMTLLDRDFRYLKINEPLAAINGPPVSEHIGKTIFEIIPNLAPTLVPIFKRILDTGVPALNIEVSGETPRAPGITQHWIVSYFPTRDQAGRITGIGGVIVEMTARKQAEDALRETEARFRQLAENLNEVFWLTDWPENRVVYVSPAFEKIWGISSDELYKNPLSWLRPIVAEDRPRVERCFMDCVESGGYDVTFRIRREDRPDREEKWIHDRGVLVRDSEGKVVRLAGIAQDITELKLAEEALKKQSRDLKLYADEIKDLYNNAPCGYHSLAPDGTFAQINDTELRWLGYSREELVRRRKFPDLITSESKKAFETHYPELMDCGYVHDLKLDMIRKDGSILPVIASATAVKDTDGKYLLSRSTLFDYTAQKKLEEDLQQALKMRDEFLSIASHDLKTPLTSLTLQIQSIQKALKESKTVQEEIAGHVITGRLVPERLIQLVDQSRRQIDRLSGLVDDLLDLTRIRVGKLVLEPTRVDLREEVEYVVSQLSEEAHRKGIPIILHSDHPVIGTWDLHRIEQIVTNLVSNAIKYGAGKPIDIWIETDQARGIARLKITDRGIGIPPRLQSKIFERFERAAGTEQIKGLGLGLYITRQVVNAHGGKIWVESEVGKGSTFTVELPQKTPIKAPATRAA